MMLAQWPKKSEFGRRACVPVGNGWRVISIEPWASAQGKGKAGSVRGGGLVFFSFWVLLAFFWCSSGVRLHRRTPEEPKNTRRETAAETAAIRYKGEFKRPKIRGQPGTPKGYLAVFSTLGKSPGRPKSAFVVFPLENR